MIYKHRKMPEVKPWQLLFFRSARKGLECNAWVVLGRQTDFHPEKPDHNITKKSRGEVISTFSGFGTIGGGGLVPFSFVALFSFLLCFSDCGTEAGHLSQCPPYGKRGHSRC